MSIFSHFKFIVDMLSLASNLSFSQRPCGHYDQGVNYEYHRYNRRHPPVQP